MEPKEKAEKGMESNKKSSSIWTIFMHADAADVLLMSLGFLGSVVEGLSIPAMLIVTGKITNDIAGTPTTSPSYTKAINKTAIIFLFVAGSVLVACFFAGYCWMRTGERQASRMRARYLKAILRQDVEYFDLKVAAASEVINSVSSDSHVIQDVISEKVSGFIANCSAFLGSYIAAFFIMWRLALVAFPTALLLIVPGIMYGRILTGLVRRIRKEYDKAGAIAEQAISSIRTVYSFVGERKTMADFSAALEASSRLGLRQGLIKGIAIGSNGVTFAIWAFLAWYGSRLVMYHGAKGGTVFAVGSTIVTGGLSLGSALADVKYLSEAIPAAERIREVIKRVPKIDSENMDGETLATVSGEVEFKGVDFSYPSRRDSIILNDFNLKVPAGKTVALVGASGSGKSTVVALLERFYDPTEGEILLDGVDIRRLQLKWLRSQMGLVSQEPALFATSIKDNILFGKENASMEDVVAAARTANAQDFISQLPDGYDTQVGEGGIQLSGGQKQRIAIATAVLKSPKILLLDEATSALDSESEKVVQEALEKASVGRTTIVIAHRLSTIRNADVIAVVQAGRVAEIGLHDELIADERGLYASLVRFQQGSNEEREVQSSFATPTLTLARDRPSSHSFSARRSFSSRSSSAKSEEQVRPRIPAPSFWRLLLLNMPEWKRGALGSLCAVLVGAVQPVYSFFVGSILAILFLKDHDEIKKKTMAHCLLFVSLSLFSLLVNIGQYYNFDVMGESLTRRVRERVLSKILTFEVGWFDQEENTTGAICSRLTKDAVVVKSLVGDRMSLLVQTTSAITVAFVMSAVIAWKLALIIIIIQPLLIVCYYGRRVLLKNMTSKTIKAQSESSKLTAEAISNLRTVTAYSSQVRILHLFNRLQEGPQRENKRQSWIAGLTLGITHSLPKCAVVLSYWFGGRLIAQGQITAKELFQTFLILIATGFTVARAGSMTSDLAKGAEAIGSLFAMLDRSTGIEPEDPDGHQPKSLVGNIEISDVDFSYPSRPDVVVLKNFSLTIEAGTSIALVGQSGSGKSTIISLIERFYDPIKGAVKIDGTDIKKYHLRSLRQHIALVSQEPTLFAGTIRENITYGTENVTESEVESAARVANAHDFISSLKNGYSTWCGDKGVQLSGGQRQRIAIARAILKNPTIFLLDEATSALDYQSEKEVQQALERVMIGRTCVVVAHRLTTIQNCDLIVVLEKGKVIEKGTHTSLLAKGPEGSYFGLVNLQRESKAIDS